MARRRTRRSKPKIRYIRRAAPKRRSRGSAGKGQILQIDSMIYGGVREMISSKLGALKQYIPLQEGADEIVMAGVAYAAGKYIPNAMVKRVASRALTVENARAGAILGQKLLGGMSSNGSISGGYEIHG